MLTKSLIAVTAFVPAFVAVTSLAHAQQQPGADAPLPPTSVPVVPAQNSPPVVAPVPVQNHEVVQDSTTAATFPNAPLLITGAILFGGSYAASAIVGGFADRDDDKKLVYPVVGPWLDLANRDCETNACSKEDLKKGVLIADGIVQGVGALGILLSLVVPETTSKHWFFMAKDGTHVAPVKIGAGYGLGAVGRF